MPNFGKIPLLVPLLNEQPLTIYKEFKFKLDERMEMKQRMNELRQEGGGSKEN
jgi:hypothetical protein